MVPMTASFSIDGDCLPSVAHVKSTKINKPKGAFSLHQTSGLPRTECWRPQKWFGKDSSNRPRMLSRMSDRLSPRQNESDVRLINQTNGLPRRT